VLQSLKREDFRKKTVGERFTEDIGILGKKGKKEGGKCLVILGEYLTGREGHGSKEKSHSLPKKERQPARGMGPRSLFGKTNDA